MPLKILVILTRNPYSRSTGRKAVQKTIVNSLVRLGHKVDLVIYDHDRSSCPADVRVFFRKPGRLIPLVLRVFYQALFGRLSLNEAIYCSGAELRFIRRISRQYGYDLVVADMIRTAPLAAEANCPVIVDLDDLLSERYREYVRNGGRGFLGYFGERLPAVIRAVADKLGFLVLRLEAARLVSREEYWVGRAAAVSLVSPLEAENLSRRTGRKIFNLPMAVNIPETPWAADGEFRHSAVYVGGMDYQPNVDAIKWYSMNVQEICATRLDIIGFSPEKIKAAYGSKKINFTGYVDDLFSELRASRVFVAPVVSGSGIKTKVLEALALGMPLVATSEAIKGIGVRGGEHCLVADTGRDFAAAMDIVISDLPRSSESAARGRELVKKSFSGEAVLQKWGEVLEYVMSLQKRKS